MHLPRPVFPCPARRQQRKRTPTGHSGLSVLAALCSMAGVAFLLQPGAMGQTSNDQSRRYSYEFEQCANACRIRLDQSILRCDGYRKPSDPEAPPKCRETFWDEYETCVKACPVGTPRTRQ